MSGDQRNVDQRRDGHADDAGPPNLTTKQMFRQIMESNHALSDRVQALESQNNNHDGPHPNGDVGSRQSIRNARQIDNANANAGRASRDGTPSDQATADTRWRAEELGFFNPSAQGHDEVVFARRDIYYRSVQLFIERIKDIALIKGAPTVRLNLSSCLRGIAMSWYTEELSNLERAALRLDENGVTFWCEALETRFTEQVSVAFEWLGKEKYTIANARNRREPAAYVQAIIRHAKAAGFTTAFQQLTWAFNGLDDEL